MKALKDMKEIIEDEIKKIAKKGDISPQELDSVYKAVDVLKDIQELCEKEEMQGGEEGQSYRGYSNDGYSRRMMWPYAYDGGQIWNRPMHEASMDGSYDMSHDYSMNRGSYDGSYDGRAGRDADSDGRYSERGSYDGSYARGRDARGRYTSRDGGSYERGGGYSRHSEKERMIDKLETMADVTTDAKTKAAIEECITALER